MLILKNKNTGQIAQFACHQGNDWEEPTQEELDNHNSQELEKEKQKIKDKIAKNKKDKLIDNLIKNDTSLDTEENNKNNSVDNATSKEELENLNLEF